MAESGEPALQEHHLKMGKTFPHHRKLTKKFICWPGPLTGYDLSRFIFSDINTLYIKLSAGFPGGSAERTGLPMQETQKTQV